MNRSERQHVLLQMEAVIAVQRERLDRFARLGRIINLADEDFVREGMELERLMRLHEMYQQALCRPYTDDASTNAVD